MAELAAVPPPDDDGPELPVGPFAGTDDALGLALPRLQVRPPSGEPYVIQVYNPDMLLYEETAAKHRWPTESTAAPVRWATFLAWAAATREGRSTAGWDEFKRTTLEVKPVSGAPATPTRPGPAPG